MCLESIKNDQETSVAGMKEVMEGFGVDNVREVREEQILRALNAILDSCSPLKPLETNTEHTPTPTHPPRTSLK